MNAKLKKVLSDMKKIEDKIGLLQGKWEELNKQKTEFENLEIIGQMCIRDRSGTWETTTSKLCLPSHFKVF